MKIKENFLINFIMTKHLFKASPRFFIVNLLNTLLDVTGNLFQMLFYQKIIDLILYESPAFGDAAKYFLLYHALNVVFFVINYRITTNFNEIEKTKINLYYKQMIYTETVKNKLEHYHDSEYMDKLHNAIYHDGSYLYMFANYLFSLINATLSLCAVGYIFIGMHPFFVVAAACIAVKNIVIDKKKNKVKYQRYTDNLPLNRCKTYINNLFYFKDYAKELRMYPIGAYFRKKFSQIYGLAWKVDKGHQNKLSVLEIINGIIDTAAQIFNIVVLVVLLRDNQITVGMFSLILSRFTALARYIEAVITFLPAVEDISRYMKDILSVMGREKHEFTMLESESAEYEDCIRFSDVFYAYHGEDYVISNVNLQIPLGKKIAIVGENGSGKSTFVKLLMGLYQPTRGEIKYYCSKVQRSCGCLFSSMFQDFQIYALSIAENIYPRYEAKDAEKIMRAISFSELAEKIDTLPQGIDSRLTKEFDNAGVYFSGGEQQKLALARAYISDKPILILDEPSSNLDPLAEKKIIEKISQLTQNRTVFLVTHNLINARSADLVYYFEQGQVVECGTPEELINAKGNYEAMLNLQLQQLGKTNS